MVELKWIKGVMIAVFSEENPDDECWVMTGCSVARPKDLQSHRLAQANDIKFRGTHLRGGLHRLATGAKGQPWLC